MFATLVVATYGRCEQVGRLIQTLATQTERDFEVLVVDQNPDDRLVPVLEAAISTGLVVRHLRLAKPNLSEARNVGIHEAIGDVIGFPDDDCWYEPGTLTALRKQFSNDGALEGAIASWVEQDLATGKAPEPGLLSFAAWRRFRGGHASSITLFFKRALFDRVGCFDARFGVGQWLGAAEETDLVLRALASGSRLANCPQARVHHHYLGKPGGAWLLLAQTARRRARGTGAIYAKHRISGWVVLRGLLAPMVAPLLHGDLGGTAQGIFITLGRAEGLWHWRQKRWR